MIMMDPFHGRNMMETYYGQVKSPNDAIILFEACRMGTLPRVQRRLSEKERQQIRSGSVFVWDEREAGMRRWTDGKSWSASRVSGSFLTYREMEGKRSGSDGGSPGQSGQGVGVSQEAEDADPMSGSDGYRYKPNGLVKQSFSINTTAGQHLHLISYFARADPTSMNLYGPSNDPALRHVHPAKGMYPDSTVQDLQSSPAVTRSPMGDSSYGPSAQYQNGENHMRHPPPQYGWPPGPQSPSAMNGQWPANYPPYGYPMPGGMPFPPWMHPAWLAQQMQMMQQYQQQQHQYAQQHTPGTTNFDRVPPPLRNSNGAPLPPPAPAQPYPQHQPQSGGPFVTSSKSSDQAPAYQNSNTYQSQYQAWTERQGHQQPHTQYSQQQQPSTSGPPFYQDGHSTSLPSSRPALNHSPSTSSVHSAHEPEKLAPPKHQSIPGINALIESNVKAPSGTSQAQQYGYSQRVNISAQQMGSSTSSQAAHGYPHRTDSGPSRAPDSREPGAPKPGHGADMNALRRLDRAFAP